MNPTSNLDVSKIIRGFCRHKNLIVAVFVVISSMTAYLAYILPDVYRSSTLILISPQRVPANFVASTVTINLGERMRSIVQEILSRTQLEKIVQEFNLYPSSAGKGNMEDRVANLRGAAKIEFRQNNVFQLSYEGQDPEKAKQVASRLASLFIEQNLQVREEQAMGTKSFINAEAERLRKELEQQESVVNRYRASYRFELPDQLDSNLRTLEQLRRELESSSQRLSALQERKGVLQKQVVESDILGIDLLGGSLGESTMAAGGSQSESFQLQMKKKELDALMLRYKEKHPDVARLKKEILALEAESKELGSNKSTTPAVSSNTNPLKKVLQTQITDIDSEIQALRAQQQRVRSQVSVLQTRVDNTPLRAIELTKISRNYDITLRKYQDLMAKSLESELSENMEKKQKGEQFQVLDPANFPIKPVRPDRQKIILLGLLGGLAAGFALAFLWDNLDTSFKGSDELDGFVNVPVLATIPASITRGWVLEERRAQGLLVFASMAMLAVGLVCVRIFGPMYF